MNKVTIIASFFLISTTSIYSASAPESDVSESNKLLIPIVIYALKQLEVKPDLRSKLAAYDFKRSILDPNYQIQSDANKQCLQNAGLMDQNGTIDQATRDAMKGQIVQ